MNNLYEALEICLQEVERGSDIEATLSHYPDLADELRPILEASVDARKMAVPAPSKEVVQRNRAKVLRHAAQMREARADSSQRIWLASFRRLAVTLAVLAILFASGTGLVRAASNTLPGDNLYPVKRTWEDVLVAFTFNVQQRDALEVEHENERLHELQEVFAEGRSAEVDFAGSVTQQNGNEWVVSNVPVAVSSQTEIRGGSISIGSAVRVKGQTQANGVVSAERIELLPAGAKLPDVGDEPEIETENHEGSNGQTEGNSGKGSGDESPLVEETQAPEQDSQHQGESVNEASNNNSNDSSTEVAPNPENSNDHGGDGSNDNTNTDHSGSNSNDSHENSGGSNSGGGD